MHQSARKSRMRCLSKTEDYILVVFLVVDLMSISYFRASITCCRRVTPHYKATLHCTIPEVDPAPATTFAHLEATTVFSRRTGIYPAVDPLDSKFRMLDPPRVVGDDYYQTANLHEYSSFYRSANHFCGWRGIRSIQSFSI